MKASWLRDISLMMYRDTECGWSESERSDFPLQNGQSEDMLKVQQAAAPLLNIIHYMCPACDSENFQISQEFGVSKNRGTPKSSILVGFSIIFTIHFGGPPLFLETLSAIGTTVGRRNLPVDTLERLEVNREMLSLGFIAQSQVGAPGTNQQTELGTGRACSGFY